MVPRRDVAIQNKTNGFAAEVRGAEPIEAKREISALPAPYAMGFREGEWKGLASAPASCRRAPSRRRLDTCPTSYRLRSHAGAGRVRRSRSICFSTWGKSRDGAAPSLASPLRLLPLPEGSGTLSCRAWTASIAPSATSEGMSGSCASSSTWPSTTSATRHSTGCARRSPSGADHNAFGSRQSFPNHSREHNAGARP
jgi:hypothetical protein